jgi:hypothetical protein
MSHGSHHGGKVSGSHQNSPAIVMSRTVENQFFRKARFDLRCPDAERFDGNTQPSCLASHLFRSLSKTRAARNRIARGRRKTRDPHRPGLYPLLWATLCPYHNS